MLILLFLIFAALPSNYSQSCQSGHHSPCAARTSLFPEIEFSGDVIESSGLEPPIYDEFITTVSPFDFSATPDQQIHSFCDCPSNFACSFDNDSYVINIDRTISLAFCDRIEDIFKRHCHRARELIRVVGSIYDNGEALTTVSDVFMFCRCDRGYRRVQIEPWTDGLYAFLYRCI